MSAVVLVRTPDPESVQLVDFGKKLYAGRVTLTEL
jgi:hypothetical protein